MKLLLVAYVFIAFFTLPQASGQNLITGKVVDEKSGEILPGANIFLAGTSIGTSSDSNGLFTLTGFPSGKYDFAVSFVGYSVLQQPLTFTGSTKIKFLVKLSPQTQMLQEVVVKPNDHDWKQNFRVFKEKLLGNTPQAKYCQILNPKDVVLFKDTENGKLIAHGAAPIQIENKALGYKIDYHLVLFEYTYGIRRLDSYGVVKFEEMKPTSDAEQAKWIENRNKVYLGSITHFLNALLRNQLVEEDFEAARVLKRRDYARPPQDVIDAKMEYYNKMLKDSPKQKNITALQDSLWHYQYLNAKPLMTDSLVNETLKGNEILTKDTLNKVNFVGSLLVKFKQVEDRMYASSSGHFGIEKTQNSNVRIISPFRVYENGYYDNSGNLLVGGYWAWSQKVSTMLPLDFKLNKNP